MPQFWLAADRVCAGDPRRRRVRAAGAQRLDGLSYALVSKATDLRITTDVLLPPSQCLGVSTATDMQIVNEIALCIVTDAGRRGGVWHFSNRSPEDYDDS